MPVDSAAQQRDSMHSRITVDSAHPSFLHSSRPASQDGVVNAPVALVIGVQDQVSLRTLLPLHDDASYSNFSLAGHSA